MYTYKHVHKQREGMIQTNKQHLSFCIKCKRVAIIAGEGLVKLGSIQISYASHLTKTLNICNISNAWTHLGFVIVSQKFHGSWFIWYIVSKMRWIRDITTSLLGLRTCGGFTQMNLNKWRVLFHWNQIFFLESHSCTVCHFLPFWWSLNILNLLSLHCYIHRLVHPSTTCTALFPVNKFIFSYITCKELFGLTMLLLLSCWIIAGKIQYKPCYHLHVLWISEPVL